MIFIRCQRNVLMILIGCLLVWSGILHANTEEVLFDIPEGIASETLMVAASQADVDILFSVGAPPKTQTCAINGPFIVQNALDQMLEGTPLVAVPVSKGTAFGIINRAKKGGNVPERSENQPQSKENTNTNSQMNLQEIGKIQKRSGLLKGLLALAIASSPNLSAQDERSEEDEVFELSPFSVESSGDIGYRAQNTLAGTRMNTNLGKTPASISVLTKELLNDLNAEVLEEYLQFATSTDRDFGADPTGLGASWTGSRVKVRGFAGVPVTRDYFGFLGISPDRYNVARVDVQKGPNSILYGIGGPGGVINSTSKRARIGNDMGTVSTTVGSFDKLRAEVDYNMTIIEDKLAIRVNGLWEDSDNWQTPTKTEKQGIALAATWRPLEKTEIRLGFEDMERFWIMANPYPAGDFGASEWLAAGAPLVADPLQPQSNPFPGILQNTSPLNVAFMPQVRDQPFRAATRGVDLRPDLDGNQPNGYWRTLPGPGAFPNARPTDLDLVNLLGEDNNYFGPGFNRDDEYTVFQAFLAQEIYGFNTELAYAKNDRYSITNNVLGWNSGIYGDPNPVVPGAYYADGDPDARNGEFPGTPLPNPGIPNPYAGGLYVEGVPAGRFIENDDEYYRLTVSREFDLTEQSKWLGRHSIAGVWHVDEQMSSGAPFSLYNVTPNNNDAPHAAANQILFRSYLDLGPGGNKWMLDPREYTVPSNTGVTPEYHFRGGWNVRSTEIEGKMAVLQSNFLDDRLIVTAGFRTDEQTLDRAQKGQVFFPGSTVLRLKPNSEFLPAGESPFYSNFKGDTKTLGAFVKITEQLGLTFNTSDSVQPQGQPDIYGDPIGNRVGDGKDYGIRLQLFEDRLYLNATYYETTDGNKALTGGPSVLWTPMQQAFGQVFQTSLENGIPLPTKLAERGLETFETRWDRWDLEGDGIELEIVGNLTSQWNLSFNYSKNTTISGSGSGYGPDHLAFLVDNQSAYDGNLTPLNEEPTGNLRDYINNRDNTPERDFTADPATFNDVYDFAGTVVADARSGAGRIPFGHNEESFNFFSTYRFSDDMPEILHNSRIGIGGNYRTAPVIGFDASNDTKEIWGDSFFIARLMVAKRLPFSNGRYLDLQLNVNNLLGEEDLLPYGTRSPDAVERYMFQRTRQSWTLKATFGF